jgi:hypothetical protein
VDLTKTINGLVKIQFEPILSYEFAKLSRKDILPRACSKFSAPLLLKLNKRMAKTLKANIFSRFPA